MNVVLAVSDTILTKSIPESDLGNFMCDLILKKSRDYYGHHVDFTFLNNGGIRLPNLPKGNITLGKIVELMPFENRIVIMDLDGVTLRPLFNHMASKGGWQVSGVRYSIESGKASDIEINGKLITDTTTYKVAVSDYLTQGGDDCVMLKDRNYFDTKKTLRDALVDGLREMTKKKEHVKSLIDGRVRILHKK